MSEVVELSIPVKADLVVLARLTAATVASRAQFDVEEIEDLRLAVDELCISLVEGMEGGRLDLRFIRDDDSIEVFCRYRSGGGTEVAAADGPSRPAEAVDEALLGLSGRILDALVDEHGRETDGGESGAWLRKRRSRQPAE
jgi:anti-sigma regulatory factor (Ser/Thr protein kinase)